MPTYPLRDSLRLHGTRFSFVGSSFFLILELEIAWLVKSWRNWLEAFETPVVAVAVVVAAAAVGAVYVAVVVGLVGLLQNEK